MKKGSIFTLFGIATVLLAINLSAAKATAEGIFTGQKFTRGSGEVCICADSDRDCAPCGNITELQ